MSIPFKKILTGEIQKSKNTWGLFISFAFPILITSIFTLAFILRSEDVSKTGVNQWYNFCSLPFIFYSLFYPVFVALIAYLITSIEHKSNGFKFLFVLPTPRGYFYFSKMLVLFFWLLISVLIALSFILLAGTFLSTFWSEMRFQEYNFRNSIAAFFVKILLANMSILSIQFILSIYFENFLLSIGIGGFSTIFGIVIAQWKYSYLIPYSYTFSIDMEFTSGNDNIFTNDIKYSLLYFVAFTLLGYFMIRRKSIK